jgi:hypothetical protein
LSIKEEVKREESPERKGKGKHIEEPEDPKKKKSAKT